MKNIEELRKNPYIQGLFQDYYKQVNRQFKDESLLLLMAYIVCLVFLAIACIINVFKGETSFGTLLLMYLSSSNFMLVGFAFFEVIIILVYLFKRFCAIQLRIGTVSKATYHSHYDEEDGYSEWYDVIVDTKKYKLNSRKGVFTSISAGETYVFLLSGKTIRACKNVNELNY